MKVLAAVFCALACLGCAGGAATKPAPDWVATPPGEDKEYMYFTGSGSSAEGSQAKAEEIARGVLIDSIMQYLGAKVTAETTSTAKASVDAFQSDVRQQITQSSSGRIAGLSLADTWLDKQKARTTVYLLAKFAKSDLAKEKKRIEAVFQEQVAAVSGPETQAKDLEEEGRFYEAAVKYIEAAAAAAKSDIDNAKIKFERNVNGAKSALDRLSLVKLNDNLKTAAGKAFAEPFRLKVVTGSAEADPGVPAVTLSASYAEIRAGGKQMRSAALKTGSDGVAFFAYPVPEFVGAEKLTVSIDLSAYLETLRKLPKELQVMVGGLEDLALKKKAVFSLEAYSQAREIATGIAVASLDAEGNPLGANDLASGILKTLTGARFKVKTIALGPGSIVGRDDTDVLAAAGALAADKSGRMIFGSAQVTGTEQDGEMVIARASGTVKVADLKTGAILLTVSRSKTVPARSAAAAAASVLQKLGEDIGQEIANKLR
ncbi:MAG: hypothetical protein NT005_15050 [Spirochaetes bacterium]|nr:hypothetical protein [Spirochaetota bacterium]